MDKPYYSVNESKTKAPSNDNFFLHTHNDYEVYLFLEGNASYIVEGKTYALNSGDIIVVRKNEMHRAYFNGNKPYRRIVLMIAPEFFSENNCADYENAFLPSATTENKISSDLTHSIGLYAAFLKLKKYTKDFSEIDTPVARAIITEIIYLLTCVQSFSPPEEEGNRVREIISYINDHFSEDISLSDLEHRFFLSKYHLSRLFHRSTGLTIHRYIIKKRLVFVKDNIKKGKNISEVVSVSGFGTYSSFYRAYKKEYGCPPGKDFKL